MKRIIGSLILLVCVTTLSAQLSMQKKEGGMLITENGENVLFYQSEPKSKDGTYERCNYIHPLWGVDGSVLTEDFPADHLHHRGVFWTWHQVWIGEKRIGDPWEIKDFEQEVVDVEFKAQKSGVAVLKTEVEWNQNNGKKWVKKFHTSKKILPF